MSYNSYMLPRLLRTGCHAKRLECVELAPAFRPPYALRQRQQAGLTPNASRSSVASLLLCAVALMPLSTQAQDWPQWGGTSARNMFCLATNQPDHFTKGKSGDIKFKGASEELAGSNLENFKWVAK